MIKTIENNDRAISLTLFLFCFIIYCCAPVIQITDSSYSMMMSQAIIEHGTVRLDGYKIEKDEDSFSPFVPYTGYPYQVEPVQEKFYYYFPHGSSVLSVPFVALINALGFNAVNDDQTYNLRGEARIERILAAALTAFAVVLVYLTSRLSLVNYAALFVSLAAAFATSLFSTVSRGMWSHTWLVVLLVVALFIVWRGIRRGDAPNPVLLATVVSWMFFVRPTASISIIAISAVVLIYFRRVLLVYCITGLAWLAGFVSYSKYHFDTWLPSYYASGRIGSDAMLTALMGNLISPARGLLVYSPLIIMLSMAVVWLYKDIKYRALLNVSILAIVLHWLLVSSFPHWWGGHSYGPRFMSDIIPWVMIIMIIVLEAYSSRQVSMANFRFFHIKTTRIISFFAVLLVLVSIFMHAMGAYSDAAAEWNVHPTNIDSDSDRLWDWGYPQFLSAIIGGGR